VRTAIGITGYDIKPACLTNGKTKIAQRLENGSLRECSTTACLKPVRQRIAINARIGAGKQPDAPLAADNAVKLMTIHKSKGLEFVP